MIVSFFVFALHVAKVVLHCAVTFLCSEVCRCAGTGGKLVRARVPVHEWGFCALRRLTAFVTDLFTLTLNGRCLVLTDLMPQIVLPLMLFAGPCGPEHRHTRAHAHARSHTPELSFDPGCRAAPTYHLGMTSCVTGSELSSDIYIHMHARITKQHSTRPRTSPETLLQINGRGPPGSSHSRTPPRHSSPPCRSCS